MRFVVAATGLLVLSTSCASAGAPSQKALLKNWALSHCLALAYENTETKEDANASASAYLEAGKQPAQAYEDLAVLAQKYLSRSYGSSVGSKLQTMKCIDLYNSVELDQLTAKLVRSK